MLEVNWPCNHRYYSKESLKEMIDIQVSTVHLEAPTMGKYCGFE